MADNPIRITSETGQREFRKIAVDVQRRIADLLRTHDLHATTTRVYRSHDEYDGSAILDPEEGTIITKVGIGSEPRWVVFTKVDFEYEASAGSFVLAEQAVYVEPIQEYPTEEVAVVHVGGEASEEEEEEIEAIKRALPRALPQVKELKIEKSKISPSPPTPSALPVTGGASDTAELTQLFSELEMSSEPSTVLVKDPPTKTDVEPDKKAKSTSQFSVLQPSATEQRKRQKKGEPEPDKAAVTIEIKGLTIKIQEKSEAIKKEKDDNEGQVKEDEGEDEDESIDAGEEAEAEAPEAEELARGHAKQSSKDQKKSKASVEVEYAYHVTNVEVVECNGKPCNQPDWSQLRCNLADDKNFDGEILFGAPCVFFTTTLEYGDFPKGTMYPRNGVIGKKYWRVKVPLTAFNNFEIIVAHEHKKQVRLLLLPSDEAAKIPEEKLNKWNADQYLRREKNPGGVKYYSNDYRDAQSRYYVNFVVCHDFSLSSGVEWDCVKRTMDMPGKPERDMLRQRSFDEVLKFLKK